MHPRIPKPTRSLLIVDDNLADYDIAVRALKKCGSSVDVHYCEDGDDALDFLLRRGAYADQPAQRPPSLVLLDLNMPGTDGKEVLAEMRNHEGLKAVPVVVLTTSSYDRDVQTCYAAGANSFLQKPTELAAYYETIRCVNEFWLETAMLPNE